MAIDALAAVMRPRTRGDCADGPRPCPWVGCRHHLYLEIDRRGRPVTHHHVDPEDLDRLVDTCSLDVADRVSATGEQLDHESVAIRIGLSKQRSQQIEERTLRDIDRRHPLLREHIRS